MSTFNPHSNDELAAMGVSPAMSTSDTPETDTEIGRTAQHHTLPHLQKVSATFARQLERSRNDLAKRLEEANECLTRADREIERLNIANRDSEAQLSTVTRERDEARAALSKASGAIKEALSITDALGVPGSESTTEAAARVKALIQERDEALSREAVMRAALTVARKFIYQSRHKDGCERFNLHPKACSCGYDDVLKAADQALSTPSATIVEELRAEVERWATSSKAWQDNHAEALEQIDTLRAELSSERERVKELEADGKRLDWMADERIFEGLGDVDIDALTLEAVKDADPNDEAGWVKEWRKQFRVAIDRVAALSASAESAKEEGDCSGCGKQFAISELTHNDTETLCRECQAAAIEPNE